MRLGVVAGSRRRVNSPSTIQYIGGGNSAGSLFTPTAHAVGDLMLAVALRSSATNLPTIASGWTLLGSTPTNAVSPMMMVAWRLATSTSDDSGTWASCNGLVIGIYRNVSAIGGYGLDGADTNTALSFPAFTTVAQQKTDQTEWIVRAYGTGANANLSGAPSGYATRTNFNRMGMFDENPAGSEGSVSGGTLSASVAFKSVTIELLN